MKKDGSKLYLIFENVSVLKLKHIYISLITNQRHIVLNNNSTMEIISSHSKSSFLRAN